MSAALESCVQFFFFFLFCCRTFSTRTCQLLCRYLERKRSLHSRQCTRINRKAIAEYPHEDEANTKKKKSHALAGYLRIVSVCPLASVSVSSRCKQNLCIFQSELIESMQLYVKVHDAHYIYM